MLKVKYPLNSLEVVGIRQLYTLSRWPSVKRNELYKKKQNRVQCSRTATGISFLLLPRLFIQSQLPLCPFTLSCFLCHFFLHYSVSSSLSNQPIHLHHIHIFIVLCFLAIMLKLVQRNIFKNREVGVLWMTASFIQLSFLLLFST